MCTCENYSGQLQLLADTDYRRANNFPNVKGIPFKPLGIGDLGLELSIIRKLYNQEYRVAAFQMNIYAFH